MTRQPKTQRLSTRSRDAYAAARRRKRSLLCALKPLEERAVPAILFTPQFGQETVHDNGGAKLSKEAVFLAFMGTYWTSGNAYPTANQIISATQSFLASTYMANLGQYGNGLGNAYYAGSAFDSTNSKNHFSYGDLNDEVNHLVDSGNFPGPRASMARRFTLSSHRRESRRTKPMLVATIRSAMTSIFRRDLSCM